jgi:hypothetical protein
VLFEVSFQLYLIEGVIFAGPLPPKMAQLKRGSGVETLLKWLGACATALVAYTIHLGVLCSGG